REVFTAIRVASTYPAALHRRRRLAAARAALVRGVPVGERDQGHEQAGVAVGQQRADVANRRGSRPELARWRAHRPEVRRPVSVDTEEERLAVVLRRVVEYQAVLI